MSAALKNMHQALSSLSDYAYHFAEVRCRGGGNGGGDTALEYDDIDRNDDDSDDDDEDVFHATLQLRMQ